MKSKKLIKMSSYVAGRHYRKAGYDNIIDLSVYVAAKNGEQLTRETVRSNPYNLDATNEAYRTALAQWRIFQNFIKNN